MRIGVVSSQVFPCPPAGYAGLEVIAYHCARGLAALGHEVYLFAPDGSHCEGATVVPTGPPGQWDEAKAYGGYWKELVKFNDGGAVVDHSWSKWAYVLKQEGRLKAPVLGVMHAPTNTMYKTLPPGVEKPCFVCISDDQRAHFEALFSPVEARTCYNGIDLEFYRPIEGIKRTERFLFLARFSSIKGPDLAIQACKEADVSLDLVGDTTITGEPALYALCKGMADGNQIKIVGPCSRGEAVFWYSRAHALVHPNQRFREPFGLAPVEAQACGVPVIAWDFGAMRETVRHGETGFLVKSQKELVDWIRSFASGEAGKHLWNPIDRARCREWAGKFSIENMAKRYEALCVEAVEGGGW